MNEYADDQQYQMQMQQRAERAHVLSGDDRYDEHLLPRESLHARLTVLHEIAEKRERSQWESIGRLDLYEAGYRFSDCHGKARQDPLFREALQALRAVNKNTC